MRVALIRLAGAVSMLGMLGCSDSTVGGANTTLCGNGVIDDGETCDDGDTDELDGCSNVCQIEAGFVCTGVPSVCTVDCGGGAGVVTCYDGPSGTAGVGQCRTGTATCIGAVPGPCIGQAVPSAEACNLLDDDCDGQVDEDNVTLSCGIGACATTANSCMGGMVQQCTPGMPGTEMGNCSDGVDNDCNGAVDDCTCIHVAPFGDDMLGDGSEMSPLLTIGAALALSSQPMQPKTVCVAADMGCNWTFFNEDVAILNGVSVFGGYDPSVSPWVQQFGNCQTEIVGQTVGSPAVTFGPIVNSPTVLDNFIVSVTPPMMMGTGNSTTVAINGSRGAQISNSSVVGAGRGTETRGIHITGGATPLITTGRVNGGAGTALGIAIHSVGSSPTIQSMCDRGRINAGGRCRGGCVTGDGIRSNRFTGAAAQWSDTSYGVLLENSPNSLVDQSVVCAAGNNEAAAVKITGDADGTIITRGDYLVFGALIDYAITAQECDGDAPWIGDNEQIGAEGDPSGMAVVAAVHAEGDCHPIIEANQLIVGGIEGSTNETRGVLCQRGRSSGVASKCNIIGNTEIRGSNNMFPTSSIGVRCEDGSCNQITGNQLIHGRGGVVVVGIQLVGPTGAFIDSNVIAGGCGRDGIGVLAEDGAGRIQNNAIFAGACAGGGGGQQFYGVLARLADGANELSLHSNLIDGDGGGGGCTSRGVTFESLAMATPPTAGLGVVRNNIIHAGRCGTSYGLEESDVDADPRIVENNDVFSPGATALYRDEGTTDLAMASDIDALTDVTAGNNIDTDPLYTQAMRQGFIQLPMNSPCVDNGTAAGAPAVDFEGDVRPLGMGHDIGPDEYVP